MLLTLIVTFLAILSTFLTILYNEELEPKHDRRYPCFSKRHDAAKIADLLLRCGLREKRRLLRFARRCLSPVTDKSSVFSILSIIAYNKFRIAQPCFSFSDSALYFIKEIS